MQKALVEKGCEFCKLRDSSEFKVYEGRSAIAFLDFRPVFPGHTLIAPKEHYGTIDELPEDLVGPFFGEVRLVAMAVEKAMGADGVFIAMNNRVSQSVPHMHVHAIPRRFKDGMHGFFWPRVNYASREEMEAVQKRIREAVGAMAKP